MFHWRASSLLGLVLAGRPVPLCALVYGAPDCRARRAFIRATDWWFRESEHARRVWLTWMVGSAIQLSGREV